MSCLLLDNVAVERPCDADLNVISLAVHIVRTDQQRAFRRAVSCPWVMVQRDLPDLYKCMATAFRDLGVSPGSFATPTSTSSSSSLDTLLTMRGDSSTTTYTVPIDDKIRLCLLLLARQTGHRDDWIASCKRVELIPDFLRAVMLLFDPHDFVFSRVFSSTPDRADKPEIALAKIMNRSVMGSPYQLAQDGGGADMRHEHASHMLDAIVAGRAWLLPKSLECNVFVAAHWRTLDRMIDYARRRRPTATTTTETKGPVVKTAVGIVQDITLGQLERELMEARAFDCVVDVRERLLGSSEPFVARRIARPANRHAVPTRSKGVLWLCPAASDHVYAVCTPAAWRALAVEALSRPETSPKVMPPLDCDDTASQTVFALDAPLSSATHRLGGNVPEAFARLSDYMAALGDEMRSAMLKVCRRTRPQPRLQGFCRRCTGRRHYARSADHGVEADRRTVGPRDGATDIDHHGG